MFWQLLFQHLISSDLWQATLQFAALLLLPALGGLISERSGVINIAQEGMMLTGAYAGVMVALATHNVLVGVIGAMIAGGLMALVHAVVSINFSANQIVSGIAISNMLPGSPGVRKNAKTKITKIAIFHREM